MPRNCGSITGKAKTFSLFQRVQTITESQPRRYEQDTVGASHKSKAAGAWRWRLTYV